MTRRLPAEWESQSGVMLTWPHPGTDWVEILDEVEKVFCQLSYHISRFEKLLVVCFDEQHQAHIRQQLVDYPVNLQQVSFYPCVSNDSWARDHAPVSIENDNQPCLLDYQFNGWGNKYLSDLDNAISQCLYEQGAFKSGMMESIPFVLEGGSIETDGQGTLLTTSNCLLSPERNPSYDRLKIEETLKNQLGVERVLWLEHGHLEGDDTDSHIDTLARFSDEQTIIYQGCDDPADSHYDTLQTMAKELKQLTTNEGKPYHLIALPLPRPVLNQEGDRLPASYANFLVINNAVLFPVYGDEQTDQQAVEKCQQAFPDREIIAINSRPLIQQFGSIHCLTMQFPQGLL